MKEKVYVYTHSLEYFKENCYIVTMSGANGKFQRVYENVMEWCAEVEGDDSVRSFDPYLIDKPLLVQGYFKENYVDAYLTRVGYKEHSASLPKWAITGDATPENNPHFFI